MEFDRNRAYSAVNADELEVGDKVITAQQLSNLKYQVSQRDYYVWTIKEIKEETYSDRFVTGNGAFPLVYLIERTRNCTNCRLCNGSIKDDPTKVCENYEPQVEPPVNCETCSKADTDRCPIIDLWKYPSRGELPEKDGEYLITVKIEGGGFINAFALYVDRRWLGMFNKPYAWQYIEPPKEEV